MNMLATAHPINWKYEHQQWDDERYGFCITYDAEEDHGFQYHATWGEGPEDTCATLEEAQKWCQDMINGWIADNVLVTPNEKFQGPALFARPLE